MSEIAQGSIGAGHYDVKFEAGKLVLAAGVDKGVVDASLAVKVDAVLVIDAIEKAIPGQVDDLVLELLKKALAGI